MTKIIVVETHNTNGPQGAWKRGAIQVPEADRLIQRVGSTNVVEYIINGSSLDADGKRSFELEKTDEWFASDLPSLLGADTSFNVSGFDIER